MYRDTLDLNPLLRARLLVHVHLLHVVERLPALQDLAKDGVLAVEVRGGRKGNEELRAVGIGPLVGHAQDAAGIVAEGGADLVVEQLVGRVEDGRRRLGLGVRGGRAGLHDEGGDDAVEGRAGVEARGAEGEEVLGRLGDRLAKDLELDVALGGVQLGAVSTTWQGAGRATYGDGHGGLRLSVGCARRIARSNGRDWDGGRGSRAYFVS